LRGVRCQWETHEADVYNLPFADNTFDVVWCAQSLISLGDRLAAIVEMKRVLRPGGTLAVLENDIFHQVLLPWPADLEMPIQRAIQMNSRTRFGSSAKLTPVRRLPQLLKDAGLHACRKRTFAADRQAPWSARLRRFLECHVEDLRQLIGKRLSLKSRRAYSRFADPERPDSVFADRAMDLTCLNVLYEVKKPGFPQRLTSRGR
jgi:SAM-dependent methyltransferase